MSEAEIRMANDQFYQALNAMLKGDMGPMRSVWSHSSDISNMAPLGAGSWVRKPYSGSSKRRPT